MCIQFLLIYLIREKCPWILYWIKYFFQWLLLAYLNSPRLIRPLFYWALSKIQRWSPISVGRCKTRRVNSSRPSSAIASLALRRIPRKKNTVLLFSWWLSSPHLYSPQGQIFFWSLFSLLRIALERTFQLNLNLNNLLKYEIFIYGVIFWNYI